MIYAGEITGREMTSNGSGLMQQCYPTSKMTANGREWGVFVINHQAVAAMERISEHGSPTAPAAAMPAGCSHPGITAAAEAARSNGHPYGGVDLSAITEYLVLEVTAYRHGAACKPCAQPISRTACQGPAGAPARHSCASAVYGPKDGNPEICSAGVVV